MRDPTECHSCCWLLFLNSPSSPEHSSLSCSGYQGTPHLFFSFLVFHNNDLVDAPYPFFSVSPKYQKHTKLWKRSSYGIPLSSQISPATILYLPTSWPAINRGWHMQQRLHKSSLLVVEQFSGSCLMILYRQLEITPAHVLLFPSCPQSPRRAMSTAAVGQAKPWAALAHQLASGSGQWRLPQEVC